MIDSESNLIRFAKIVERYPLLYFGYNQQELCYMWETVASSVRLEMREECTVEELKRKWKAMRGRFIYYAKKLSQGGKLSKQKECDMYNALAFLYPSVAERYNDIPKCPPPVPCNTDDNHNRKRKGKWKTTGKTSIRTYGNNKNTAVDHDSVSDPDNLGQITRSRKKTRSGDLGQITRSDDLAQSTRSRELGQSTGSGDKGLSTEQCSTAIKAEAPWDLTEKPISSDSDNDVKPNIMESINFIKIENFPDDMTESTSFDVQETEGNFDMEFFRSILPDIVNFTPQEKRQFKMGVLKLIDEIETHRK